MLIAIDGPAASGKGTLARRIAGHFGLVHLDTGRLYRAVGYEFMQQVDDVAKAEDKDSDAAALAAKIAGNLDIAKLTDNSYSKKLTSEGVGRAASIVSAIPAVRKALLDFQRMIASTSEGAVLDGRDIGTVVCPDANVKLFITAGLETRAQRRYKELQKQDDSIIYADILQDLQKRDERDRKRSVAPLLPAEDAIQIDTSEMDMDEVFEKALSVIASGDN